MELYFNRAGLMVTQVKHNRGITNNTMTSYLTFPKNILRMKMIHIVGQGNSIKIVEAKIIEVHMPDQNYL